MQKEKKKKKRLYASTAKDKNPTFYFQATLTRVLEGLICMVWVDDVMYWGLDEIYWGLDETDVLNTLELISERLEEVGLYAAAHKCTRFETSIT